MQKISISVFVIIFVVLLSGCSYRAQFLLINRSGKEITVRYRIHNTEKMMAFPMLGIATLMQFEDDNTYNPLPADRFTVDREKLEYTVGLNDQEVLFLTMADIRDIHDEPVFKSGISELSIKSDSGEVSFSGDKVFSQFEPGRRGLFPADPLLYKITYK